MVFSGEGVTWGFHTARRRPFLSYAYSATTVSVFALLLHAIKITCERCPVNVFHSLSFSPALVSWAYSNFSARQPSLSSETALPQLTPCATGAISSVGSITPPSSLNL